MNTNANNFRINTYTKEISIFKNCDNCKHQNVCKYREQIYKFYNDLRSDGLTIDVKNIINNIECCRHIECFKYTGLVTDNYINDKNKLIIADIILQSIHFGGFFINYCRNNAITYSYYDTNIKENIIIKTKFSELAKDYKFIKE